MRTAAAIGLVAVLALATGCAHQRTMQLKFDESMSLVEEIETPAAFNFPAPSDQEVQIELIDGTRIVGTVHVYEATAYTDYAAVLVSLDFQTLSELKSYRGTARIVIWEPEGMGVAPYAIHLEKGQSPESMAMQGGRILAVLDLRRVN
ncbi:MAG: hypothetical protein HY720_02945 [Planctomycetes bacterium]|nr:hypothetical protein [Planctomycetota bacterium]